MFKKTICILGCSYSSTWFQVVISFLAAVESPCFVSCKESQKKFLVQRKCPWGSRATPENCNSRPPRNYLHPRSGPPDPGQWGASDQSPGEYYGSFDPSASFCSTTCGWRAWLGQWARSSEALEQRISSSFTPPLWRDASRQLRRLVVSGQIPPLNLAGFAKPQQQTELCVTGVVAKPFSHSLTTNPPSPPPQLSCD